MSSISIAEKIKLKLKEIEDISKDNINKSNIEIDKENNLSENENENENENDLSNIYKEINDISNFPIDPFEDSEIESNHENENQKENKEKNFNERNFKNEDKDNNNLDIYNENSLNFYEKNCLIYLNRNINEIDNKNLQNINEDQDLIKYSTSMIQKISHINRASIKTNYCTDEINNNKNHFNYIELGNSMAMDDEIEEEEDENENFKVENFYKNHNIEKKLNFNYMRSKTCLDNWKYTKRHNFFKKIDYQNSQNSDDNINYLSEREINIDNLEYEYDIENENENENSNYENYNDNHNNNNNNKINKNEFHEYRNKLFSKNLEKNHENYNININDNKNKNKINKINNNINSNNSKNNFIFEEKYLTRKSRTNSLHANFCNIDIIYNNNNNKNNENIINKNQESSKKLDIKNSNNIKINNSNRNNDNYNNKKNILNLISCNLTCLKKLFLLITLFILLIIDPIIIILLKIIDLIKFYKNKSKREINENENQYKENYIKIENLPEELNNIKNNINDNINENNTFEDEKNLTYNERYYNFFFSNQICKIYRKRIKSIFIGASLFANILILAYNTNMENYKFILIFFLNNLYLLYHTLDLYNDKLIKYMKNINWNNTNNLFEIEK
jgi:hypothetical protein